MSQQNAPMITFARLPEVPLDQITAHMSDPRVTRHLPLMPDHWDDGASRDLVAAKEASWAREGLGHWAFLQDGAYVGWGGFQKEGAEWDFGLVLTARAFGLGGVITRQALEFARGEPRISEVTFLLPPSRHSLRGLARMGATQVGRVTYDGAEFLKFHIDVTRPG
ncbi:GNAT family N-acetyltransferase [Epibacterium ulvae]|uniref:GNAT family N-acetyltransferase n=1 Tax=Epibacterium ulvae TaxID=1156985 RepID=UPI001BFC8A4E|nr:GNAT family N-acetyltransferase [Epibacterium ulvae]MBT8153158.1 GNAT family N-acetyltransferase [Epibacterium ulvae]